MPPEDNDSIVRRLQSAKGHLQSVIAMVEAGETCENVLHQLHAVQAALHAAGRVLIEKQVQESQMTIQYSECPEERGQALERLLLLYQVLTRSPDPLLFERKTK